MKLVAGTVVADRFRLVRELGEGGMGSVWLAHHEKLDMACAVKFIHADVADFEGVRERFEREAKIAGQIKSPHVVQVLDYGVSGNVPYIAMEYLDGEDLAKRLDTRGRLSPEEAVTIISQVARALTKAHSAGLVHRDLKPENVFLVRDDDREIVKVLDFGIAKAQTPLDAKTKTGALLGTPRFMSPEQAQGQKTLDHRSDLWSLGVIGYRCVVGYLPFDSDAIGDLMMRIIVHPLPIPSLILPGLPKEFDAWWLRAAARDPANRFQSAKDLSEALAAAFGVTSAMSGRVSVSSGTVGATPVRLDTPSGAVPGAALPHAPAARAYTPAASAPLPQAMVGAPTVMPDGRAPTPGYASQPSPFASPVIAQTGQTLGAASRTWSSPPKKSSAGLALVVGAIALVGGTGIVFGVRAMFSAPTEASSSSAPSGAAQSPAAEPPAPSATHAPDVAPSPSAEPTATTDATAPTASAAVAHPKSNPRPPAPARTGKVRIRP